MVVKSYRDLIVWQKSLDLVDRVYEATGMFPPNEIYGLTSQVRRAAVSVPSNIAEGHARQSIREFLRFLSIARGSLAELETQLIIAKRRSYISPENLATITSLIEEIQKMIAGLMNKLPNS